MTGSYGTNGTFTGLPLATSDRSNPSTNYIVVFYHPTGTSTDRVSVGTNVTASTHSGSRTYSEDGSSWNRANTSDAIFYVYTILMPPNIQIDY